jgi:predicted dehydrogenase
MIRVTSGTEVREEQIKGVDQYQLEAEEFADSLLKNRQLRIGAEDALGTLRTIAALHRSARNGGAREPIA